MKKQKTKNSMSKKHSIILVVIVLVVLVLVGAGCGRGKYSSPEKTYSLFIKAMEEGNIDAYLECFTEESQQSQELLKITRRVTPETLKAVAERYKAAELKVIEKTDDMDVMTLETAEAGVLIFKKEKGNWKIDIIQPQRDAKRVTDLMGTLRRGALEFYWNQHEGYPVLTDTSEDGEFLKVLIDDGYLAEMLLDPLHPKYFYEYEGTKNSYTLKCYCEIRGGYCDMADGVKDHVLIITFP